jgi:repressor LexA
VTQALTTAEQQVLAALCRALRDKRLPTLEEIRRSAGIPSVATLHAYLDRLQRRGVIRRDPTRPRAITVDCAMLKAPDEAMDIGDWQPDISEEPTASGEQPAPPPSEEPTASGEQPAPAAQPSSAPNRSGSADETRATPGPAMVTVKRLGDIAAGIPTLAREEIEEVYLLPRDFVGSGEDLFMLQIRGESMLEAGIHDRDFVVVRPQTTAEHGDIVAVRIGDEATVKRLSRSRGGVLLLSDNPLFEPIEAAGAELLGKVVAVIRRLT